MKPNTALNTAFTVSKIGVYAAVALGAMACSSLRPFGQEDEFRAKLKAPEITGASQAAPQVTLPIERLPSDTFWVRPQISEGELPSRVVENLSVTERGLFDVLQLIFASTNMPLSFEGGADAASRYGVVTLNNLSGTLPQVMNKLGEIMGFFWTVTESGVLRIMPEQQFVVTMPPVLNEDSMAGITNTMQYLGARDVYLDRINRSLVFRANRRALSDIQNYLERARATRSLIVYDMNVLQVDLNDSNNMGVRWELYKAGGGINTAPDSSIAGASSTADRITQLTRTASGIETLIFGENFSTNFLIDFLKSQGDVKTLSQPKIGLMNGTNGNIRVGHLRIRAGARSTSVDVGGAEDGLIFRVGQGSSGGIGDQTYNTVLTLKPDQSAVFAGRVDVQSLYVNGQQVAPVNKANIDAALTFTSTVGAAYPQSSLALGINALDADPRAGNVAIGEGVLTSLSPSAVNTDGIFNTGVGFNALTLNSTGSNNTAVGTYTLNRNTSGYSNTAIGVYAMVNTTTGFDNVGVGVNALNLNSAGSRNNAVGVNALYSNSTGTKNNALGTNTLFLNTTGYQNVAIGDNALYTNSAGYQNVAVGPDALYNNTTGYQNIAMGYNSQRNTSTGYRNTSVGANALLNNTDGFENSAFGVNALLANTSGDYNSAFGMNSLLSNTLGERNVAVGFNTLLSNTTGSNNVAVGANALLKNTTGSENTAVGDNALFENTTGHSNAAVGRGALNNNTTGYYNIAVGRNALLTNSTGYNNSALGYNSLIFNTTGYNNAALGRNTLQNNTTGLNNTALGTYSMFGSTTGFDNTAVGLNSLYSNTTGNSNVSLGMNALFGNATGSYNMGLGRSSDVLLNNLNYASAIGAFARVTTSNTLVLGALGAGKDGVVSSVNDQVVIGATSRNDTISNTIFHVAGVSNFSSTLYATGGAQVSSNQLLRFGGNQEGTDTVGIYRTNTASDQSLLRIGIGDNANTFGTGTSDEFQVGRLNSDDSFNPVFRVAGNGDVIASGYMQATAFNVSSDRRLKTNIRAQDSGSVLSRLEQLQTYSYEYLANPNLGRRIGVIAQEIQSLFPEAVATRADGMMSVDYSALGAMAAMGVGQLSKQVKVLDKTVADQGQRITVLDDRINQHDTRITSLESWRTDTSKRMDGMQTAIDLNIQKIAENTVAIQTNSAAIERLDDALFNLDGQVKNNSDLINNINSRWARNFSESDDGSVLAVNAVELKVSNFTAQQLRANSVYSQRLEAEMARIADLEVNNLKANSAVANTVRAEQVNTGSAQVYAGVGLPAVLFAAKSDGHYTVSTSALDGSYATATVIVNAGQAKVVSVASEGIELYAEGNQVKVIAAGKSIKASWIKMG